MKNILFFIIIISIKWAFEMRKGVNDGEPPIQELSRFTGDPDLVA